MSVKVATGDQQFHKNIWFSQYNKIVIHPELTHWGRVTHKCVTKVSHHWLKKGLVAYSAPSHYLNQCWFIVNWCFRNIIQWNFSLQNKIFIQGNAFENVVCETMDILSPPQCINPSSTETDYFRRWLLMPWLLALPGHLQQWYWYKSLSSNRKHWQCW